MSGEDEATERFLSDLVHDLRNLQEGMGTALFHDEKRDSELQNVFHREVYELVWKIEDFLDLSRLRHGRIEPQAAPIRLSSLCHSSVQKLSPFLEGRTLSFDLGREETVALADRGFVEKIVASMIHAAARLTRQGDVIAVETGTSGDKAIVGVRFPEEPDSGDRLERFFSLGAEARGSLGVARELARLSGGELTWEERENENAQLVLALPGDSDTSATADRPRVPAKKLSILVVDDRRDSAKSLAMLLSVAGHETEVRHDGRSALEAVRSHRPDVVLLDIGLPDVDGYEVCRRLRQSPDFGDTLLVAVSGRGDDEARKLSRDAGFDAHLLKPIDREELTKLLRHKPAK